VRSTASTGARRAITPVVCEARNAGRQPRAPTRIASSSTAALVAALTRPSSRVRLDALLAQHALCRRSAARDFLRTRAVTLALPGDGDGGGAPRPARRGGELVDPRAVRVDGAPLPLAGVPLHVALHKPAGVVVTAAEDEGTTVFDLLPGSFRSRSPALQPAGRLDKGASGLLVLTVSGALNARLAGAAARTPKRYLVALATAPADAQLAAVAAGGLPLADGATSAPAAVARHTSHAHVAVVTLTEGRHHHLRRVFAAVGAEVTGIHRVGVGGLTLLPPAPGGRPPAPGGEARSEQPPPGEPPAAPAPATPPSVLRLAPGEWALLDAPRLEALLSGPAA